MAQLKQTSITGSLNVSGSTIIMPNLTASVDSGSTGQLWIDDSPGLYMKFTCVGSFGSFNSPYSINGAWSTGGNMINSLYVRGGAGTQNAALAAGGSAFPVYCQATEEYDGSSWSAGPNTINIKGYASYGGSQNAAWLAGGTAPVPTHLSCTEEYNGSSWSTGGVMITAKYYGAGAGSQNAAINMGGQTPATTPGATDNVQIYDGSTWATETSMINVRRIFAGGGQQNAAVAAGIYPGSTKSEKWDGTSWTEGNPLLQDSSGAAMSGCQYSNLLVGGNNPSPPVTTDKAFYYDGINWSLDSSLITSRRLLAAAPGGGSVAAESSLVFGGRCGNPATNLNNTEEYSKTFLPLFTYSAWGKSGNLNTARNEAGGTGTQNAALVAGAPTATEEFDGSVWSSGGTLINSRTLGMFAFGTQNAAAIAGGYPGSDPGATVTEEYDGSSWSAGGTLITGRYGGNNASGGTQNAGVIFGGYSGPNSVSCTEEYNGTSWASGGALIQGRRLIGGAGTQNSALAAGGLGPSPSYTMYTCHEQYNGTAWSTATALPIASQASSTSGDDNDNVLLTGGSCTSPSITNLFCSNNWDGTSWSNEASLIKNRSQGMRAGSSTTALVAGGNISPSSTGITELYCSACESKCEYNSNIWSKLPSMLGAAGYGHGFGTLNAAAVAGGNAPPALSSTEEYNGSSWSEGGTMITARFAGAVARLATQDAGMIGGGQSNNYHCQTEEYNGASWATGGNTINTMGYRGGAGTQNAALAVGGYKPVPLNAERCVEEYNGSTWSSVAAVPGNQEFNIPTTGTQNATIIAGGASNPPTIDNHCSVKTYDGTTWSNCSNNLITGRQSENSMTGTQTCAIIAGGRTPTFLASTEIWDGYTWSIGRSLPIAIQASANLGISNAAMVAGGRVPGYIANVYSHECTVYKPTGWYVGDPNSTGRSHARGAGSSVNSGMLFGGSPNASCTEVYDGSSWSTGGALSCGRATSAGFGTTTDAAVIAGGSSGSPYVTCKTELWDGSTWSGGPNTPTSFRCSSQQGGSQNTGLVAGFTDISTAQNTTIEFNGSSWSSGGNMTFARGGTGVFGTSNAGVVNSSDKNINGCVEEYNGSSWSAGPNSPVSVGYGVSGGSATSGRYMGGRTPSRTIVNQEWLDGVWANGHALLVCTIADGSWGTFNSMGVGGANPTTNNFTMNYCTSPTHFGGGGTSCFAKTISTT